MVNIKQARSLALLTFSMESVLKASFVVTAVSEGHLSSTLAIAIVPVAFI